MGHSCGFNWDNNPEVCQKLEDYVIFGYPMNEVAALLSREFNQKFTSDMLHKRLQRKYGSVTRFLLGKESDAIEIYESKTLKMDDYMLFCDLHSPYHSEEWINRGLLVASKFKIKKLIVIGDLFEFNFARSWLIGGKKNIDEEIETTEPVINALKYFDKVYLLKGNHENRIERLTDSLVRARHIMAVFGVDIYKKKFEYIACDRLFIRGNKGLDWMCAHPQSYRQTKTSVAQSLAEKFHCHVINTHGHFVGMTHDRSGMFLAVDLGGMFEKKKIAYINIRTTTHPVWKNGFGMLRNEKFWHFTDMTDFNYFLHGA